MNIGEMHVMFRQFAQQMGMQNVRAILPEQIDLLLNTSISDTVNQLIVSSVGATNDRIITDNSKILQINSLKTLYKVKPIEFQTKNGFEYDVAMTESGKFDIDLSASYKTGAGANQSTTVVFPDYLFIVDFSLNYCGFTDYDAVGGWDTKCSPLDDLGKLSPNFISNIYPVRLIDDAFLADTLNDFILKPSMRSPVMVVVNNKAELYLGKLNKLSDGSYLCQNNVTPYQLRMSYIAKPKKVAYLEDFGANNENCDLPENLHVDVVKHAVDLYRAALAINQPMQQQPQQQQEEQGRTQQQRQ